MIYEKNRLTFILMMLCYFKETENTKKEKSRIKQRL